MANKADEKFDMEKVDAQFCSCILEDGTLSLKPYIGGYRELCKFLQMMGGLFTFVVMDAMDKIVTLEKHMKNAETGHHYETAESMINYELENDLVTESGKLSSGCRTLLRLHRGLNFMRAFLDASRDIDDQERLTNVAWQAYEESLAPYHAWIVRKTVGLAMYTLPTKEEFIRKGGNTLPPDELYRRNVKFTQTLKDIHALVQKLYEDHKLLDIP